MGIRVRGTLTEVRRATEDDADLLVHWHADPDVARYWDGETFTREQILGRLARSDVDAYIVEVEGRPVGYLQAWRGTGRSGGLDMFLIPDARGRGYGPDAARALGLQLHEQEGWAPITVDPYVSNQAAVRAWERAGFVPVGQRPPDEEHAEPWLLMEFES
ncbi:MAG: GNAT family N-acetyltransferase [Gaiellaceae bacterium]